MVAKIKLGFFLLFLAFPAFPPFPAFALELYTGWGFLEGGDDRWQLVQTIQGKFPPSLTMDLDYSHLAFGPVTKTTVLLGISKEMTLFFPKNLYAQVGAGYLKDITELEFQNPSDKVYDQTSSQDNLGVLLGIHWRSDFSGLWQYSFSWQSYVFAAGPLAGLFLATGRKQLIHGGVGFAF